MLYFNFLYPSPSKESIQYSVDILLKTYLIVVLMFNYVRFLSSIALYLKSPVIETNFMYAWSSCLSGCVCRYIQKVLSVGSNHF